MLNKRLVSGGASLSLNGRKWVAVAAAGVDHIKPFRGHLANDCSCQYLPFVWKREAFASAKFDG